MAFFAFFLLDHRRLSKKKKETPVQTFVADYETIVETKIDETPCCKEGKEIWIRSSDHRRSTQQANRYY